MTAFTPIDPEPQSESVVPVIGYHNRKATEAFRVYSALCRLAVDDNELGRLPLMIEIRRYIYQRFEEAFEAAR